MIRSFRHAGLEKFFKTGSRSGVQPAHARKLQLQLTALNTASYLGDIAKFESWGLHSLKADMIEKSSISVSGNWSLSSTRMMFRLSITGITTRGNTMQMHDPAHPGEVLKELMGDAEVTAFAVRLGVDRTTLSRLLNGRAGISASMALRLEAELGTTAEMWMNMQAQHDLWQARQPIPFRSGNLSRTRAVPRKLKSA